MILVAALFLIGAPAASAQETDIVGGTPTTIEEWPWQVAIARPPTPTNGNGQDRQFCGGSLVSPTAVLTAAHCAFEDRGFNPPTSFSVITGRTTLSNDSGPGSGAEIAVTDLFYFVDVAGTPTVQSVNTLQPPGSTVKFDQRKPFDWDVVILQLASAAPAPAEPIELATTNEFNTLDVNTPGDQVFATGYGTQFFGSLVGSNTLNEVELMTKSDTDCGDGTSYGSDFLPDVMVCAGRTTPPGDSCQGDSGGPLVFDPAGPESFKLIGDTSFGVGCAVPEQWGVYGRVADCTMRPLIVAAIARASGAPAPPATTCTSTTGTTGQPTGPAQPVIPMTPADPTLDRVAPETTLTRTPGKRTRSHRATFEWTSTESASFVCQIDQRAPKRCTSPKNRRVRRGNHTFTVTATDAAGNVESTPASYSWKVKKRKRR